MWDDWVLLDLLMISFRCMTFSGDGAYNSNGIYSEWLNYLEIRHDLISAYLGLCEDRALRFCYINFGTYPCIRLHCWKRRSLVTLIEDLRVSPFLGFHGLGTPLGWSSTRTNSAYLPWCKGASSPAQPRRKPDAAGESTPICRNLPKC